MNSKSPVASATTLSQAVNNRAYETLIGSDMLATRFSIVLGSLLWALFLLWPGDLFPTAAEIAAGQGRTTYALMAQVASETIWASLFLFQAAVMSWSLIFAVRNRFVFLADALLGCILWTASTILCFVAHFKGWATYRPPAAMSAEVAMTFASWWHFVRYMFDERAGK